MSSSVSSVNPPATRAAFSSLSSWSPGMNMTTSLPSSFFPDRAFTVEDSGMSKNAASSAMVCTPGVATFSIGTS